MPGQLSRGHRCRSVGAIRSGDKYFVTPTPTDKQTAWDPVDDSVFIIPDDNDVRIQLTRGADYALSVESTARGQLAFDC